MKWVVIHNAYGDWEQLYNKTFNSLKDARWWLGIYLGKDIIARKGKHNQYEVDNRHLIMPLNIAKISGYENLKESEMKLLNILNEELTSTDIEEVKELIRVQLIKLFYTLYVKKQMWKD